MTLVRVRQAMPLQGFRLRLMLTDGTVIKREVSHLLVGPIFDPIRNNPALFFQARAEAGTVVWPNGADPCSDVMI